VLGANSDCFSGGRFYLGVQILGNITGMLSLGSKTNHQQGAL
jgi:hypothetical protein